MCIRDRPGHIRRGRKRKGSSADVGGGDGLRGSVLFRGDVHGTDRGGGEAELWRGREKSAAQEKDRDKFHLNCFEHSEGHA